ncbi:hypothetical protein QUB63_21245 [Microcoleus sp. ARI1-B5]|uniref:hypothetical protein n=1 Tax=unclassified Microcoleus TaxID=2642155 RepID=UPI002FCEADD6
MQGLHNFNKHRGLRLLDVFAVAVFQMLAHLQIEVAGGWKCNRQQQQAVSRNNC